MGRLVWLVADVQQGMASGLAVKAGPSSHLFSLIAIYMVSKIADRLVVDRL
jgi:hypothetical protein